MSVGGGAEVGEGVVNIPPIPFPVRYLSPPHLLHVITGGVVTDGKNAPSASFNIFSRTSSLFVECVSNLRARVI
jgi:hypothetical protein